MPPRRLGPHEASLTDQLEYWAIRDGVVLLADGRVEVGLEVRLPPTALADDGLLPRTHAALVAALRHGVPQGERLRLLLEVAPARLDLVDAYEALTSSPHPAASLLAAARAAQLRAARAGGRLVEHRAFVTCTVAPPGPGRPLGRRARFRALSPEEWRGRVHAAHAVRRKLGLLLDRAGLAAEPLENQALFELAWRWFNPGLRAAPPRYHPPRAHLPEWLLREHPDHAQPTLRSQLLGGDVLRLWRHLRLGGTEAVVVSMGNLPVGETVTGMLGHLLALPCAFWLALDVVHKPQGAAQRGLMAQARRLHAATGDQGGFTDYSDPEVRVGAGQTDEALLSRALTGSHVHDVGLAIVLLGQGWEQVEAGTDAAVAALARFPGVNAVVETAGLWTQFLKLAPLHGGTNERVFLTFEENAADLMPYDGPWRGSGRPAALLWNRWDGLTALDPFDPSSRSWNAVFVGATGGGKTFLAQSLLGELLRQDVEAIIVDRGYGYAPLVELFDGRIVPVEPGAVSVNPFDLPEGEAEPGDEKKALLKALLRAMLPGEGGPGAAVEDALLTAAVEQTYARATVERRVDGAVRRVYGGARLSDLARVLVTLEGVGDRPASPAEKEIARGLALRLQPWLGDSPLGRFLDRPTSVPGGNDRVTYYETSAFARHPELRAVGLLLIADLVWRRVRQDPGRRKVVVLDEAWALLQAPEAAAFVVELFRRFRTFNAAAWAVTQSLRDFTTEAARGVLQNTTYHYLLPLPGEDDLVANLLRLPPRAMEAFRSLAGRRGEFTEALAWVRREDRLEGDVVVVRPTPLEYWAYTTHGDDREERRRAMERHGGRLLPALLELAERSPRGTA